MTMVERQCAFERVLPIDDGALLLATFLRLIVVVEQTVREQLEQLVTIEAAHNPEFYFDVVQQLMRLDMLAYVSGSSDFDTSKLRHLLDVEASATIIGWYQHQWSASAITANDILAAIAGALRTAMTVIYGHIQLLQVYTKPNARQEAAYNQIVTVVDTLRACRNQLRVRLEPSGVEIQRY